MKTFAVKCAHSAELCLWSWPMTTPRSRALSTISKTYSASPCKPYWYDSDQIQGRKTNLRSLNYNEIYQIHQILTQFLIKNSQPFMRFQPPSIFPRKPTYLIREDFRNREGVDVPAVPNSIRRLYIPEFLIR